MKNFESQFLKSQTDGRHVAELEMCNLEEILESLASHSNRSLVELASHLYFLVRKDATECPERACINLDLVYVVSDLFALLRTHTELLHEKADRAKAISDKF